MMIFLTPGPTKTQPELFTWIKEAEESHVYSLSHRTRWFEGVFERATKNIRSLLSIPNEYMVAFVGSATEIWERSIECCVEKESFHIVNGEFSNRFFGFSKKLGRKNPHIEIAPTWRGSFAEIEIPTTSEMLCFAQNETSTGMMIPNEDIALLRKKYPHVLFAVDIVSAAPAIPLDFSLIDCAFFSVQKGFALPAGLGVVIVSPRAIEKAQMLSKKLPTIGTYHSFLTLKEHADNNQTVETPNVVNIWLLEKASQKYLSIGRNEIEKETRSRAQHLIQLLSPLGLSPLVEEPRFQSITVLGIKGFKTSAKEVKTRIEKEFGIQVGAGYGPYANSTIRIANFPVHTTNEHECVIEALKQIIMRP